MNDMSVNGSSVSSVTEIKKNLPKSFRPGGCTDGLGPFLLTIDNYKLQIMSIVCSKSVLHCVSI